MTPGNAFATADRFPPGCTIAAATGNATNDGTPMLMSTSDDPFATRTRLVVEQPRDGFRYIATQIISPPPVVSWSRLHLVVRHSRQRADRCHRGWHSLLPVGQSRPLASGANRPGDRAPRAVSAGVSRKLSVRGCLRGDLPDRSEHALAADHHPHAGRRHWAHQSLDSGRLVPGRDHRLRLAAPR
jgi:hypothetical protein